MACSLTMGAAGAVPAACIADLPADTSPGGATAGNGSICGDGYIDIEAGEQCDPGPGAGTSTVTECSPTCKVQCPSGHVGSGNNYCYQMTAKTPSLTMAQTRCQLLSPVAQVVTFASEAEFVELARWVHEVDAGPLWVGLQMGQVSHLALGQFEPGWAPTCSGCYAHTSDASVPLPLYVDGGPDGGRPPTQLCVVAFSDTASYPSWFQMPCTQGVSRIHAVCERRPLGTHARPCDGGICIELVATHGRKRYVFQASPVTADEAKRQCELSGGKLAVLESREEREQLWHEFSHLMAPPASIWIGLARSGADTADAGEGGLPDWIWDDGTRAEGPDAYPSPWGEGQPSDAGLGAGPPTANLGPRRAFLNNDTLVVDNTLARDVGRTTSPFVCQLPVNHP